MASRFAALGVIVLCVIALGLTAAGLPAVSPEAVGDGDPVGSENSSVDSGEDTSSGTDNRTYRMWTGISQTVNGSLSLVPGASEMLPGDFSGREQGSDGAGGESGGASVLTVSQAVFGVAALALVGAVLTLRSVSGSADETLDEPETEDEESAAAAAAAAGRAADAVADADGDPSELSNAVYRAWGEMTTALDVAHPDTATPGEFAAAARDAGFDPGTVDDLTVVFEAVRYGDEPVADHEDRALAALRALERDADTADADRAGASTDSGNADSDGADDR
jgi:hypothetical protein